MKRVVAIGVLILSVNVLAHAQAEIFDPIKNAIKASDATALVKLFASAVEVELDGNTYGKAQSEFVLKDFLRHIR